MRKLIFIGVGLCLALGSCANLKTAYTAITTSTVPAKAVYTAAAGFNVAETAATGYIQYCTAKAMPPGCNASVIQTKLDPQIKKGRTARNTLISFLQAHPGALADKSIYQTIVDATTTVNTLLATYDTRPATVK